MLRGTGPIPLLPCPSGTGGLSLKVAEQSRRCLPVLLSQLAWSSAHQPLLKRSGAGTVAVLGSLEGG